jgi:hypothetical protein
MLAEFFASKGVDKEELEAFFSARVEQEWEKSAGDARDLPDRETLSDLLLSPRQQR